MVVLTIDIYGVGLLDAFEEQKHPRAKSGKNRGEFVKKGSGGSPSAAKPLSVTAAHKSESRAYSEWLKEYNRLYDLHGGKKDPKAFKQKIASNGHLNVLKAAHEAARAASVEAEERDDKKQDTPEAKAKQQAEREHAKQRRKGIEAAMTDDNVWSARRIEKQFGAKAVQSVRQYVWSDKTKDNELARKTLQDMVIASKPLPSSLTSYRSITVSPEEASRIVDLARKGTLNLRQPESFDTDFGVSLASTLQRTGGGKQMVVLEVRADQGVKVAWLKSMDIGTASFDEHIYGAGQKLKVIGVRPFKQGSLTKYHIITEAMPSEIKREQKMAARWD